VQLKFNLIRGVALGGSGLIRGGITVFDKIYQWLTTDRLFSSCTPVSSTNKPDSHDITEILLKVALNTITLTLLYKRCLLARRRVYQSLTQCYDFPIKFRSCSDGVVIFDFIFFILLQVKQNIYQICNALLIVDRTRFVQKTFLWIHWKSSSVK
jgi:hypothetical protein